jgi:hypothetical protein
MSTFDRKAPAATVFLTFALLGMQSGNGAEPAKPATDESRLNCKPEIRRVALWPHGPRKKVLEIPRYQTLVRFVCEGEEKAGGPRRVAAVPSFGPRKQ